jgi:hypothetical protein
MVNARDSHGYAYGVLTSPAGWRKLAGGNTPGNRAAECSRTSVTVSPKDIGYIFGDLAGSFQDAHFKVLGLMTLRLRSSKTPNSRVSK